MMKSTSSSFACDPASPLSATGSRAVNRSCSTLSRDVSCMVPVNIKRTLMMRAPSRKAAGRRTAFPGRSRIPIAWSEAPSKIHVLSRRSSLITETIVGSIAGSKVMMAVGREMVVLVGRQRNESENKGSRLLNLFLQRNTALCEAQKRPAASIHYAAS